MFRGVGNAHPVRLVLSVFMGSACLEFLAIESLNNLGRVLLLIKGQDDIVSGDRSALLARLLRGVVMLRKGICVGGGFGEAGGVRSGTNLATGRCHRSKSVDR